ncbi:MAG: molybdenum cofactor guanylyltransferase [Planctomycetota bacterium]|nr:molybdenum cofactor guanylyltransferase [Planctomycetota bacterium]
MKFQGAIIAGGEGSRLGGCIKALLPTPDGTTLLRRNAQLLEEISGCLPLLSTNDPTLFLGELGLDSFVEDLNGEKIGPLGGFLSTLRKTEVDALIFVAGDMPFLDKAVLQSFVDEFQDSGHQGLWSMSGGFGQPFPSILSKSCLPELEMAYKDRLFSLQKVFQGRLSMATWSEESKCALDPEGRSFNNINSYADLESYLGLNRAQVMTLLSQQSRAQAH